MILSKPASRALSSTGIGAAVLWAGTLALWLIDSGGIEVPATLARVVVSACLLLTAGSFGAWLYARVAGLDRDQRQAAWALLVLVLLSMTVFLIGIDHEIGKGYYRDEGHYLKHAGLVGDGQFFTPTFIYPHLLYYLDAFGLWVASLFPTIVASLARGLYGVAEGPQIDWLVLRWIAAACGGLTVAPVFLLARRLGGWMAGLLGGLTIIFSSLYSSGFSVNISDGPAAFFAACCLACCGLILDDERPRNYLLAGLAAGLAAGCKYPAGVVAVAIVGVWLYQRARHRNLRPGLIWAGFAAIGAFVATTPSFLVYPQGILGKQGIFFGVRQYGEGGWIGVMPTSNTFYYLEKIVHNFGWPLILLALAGAFALDPERRRRSLALSPFPAIYFVLICTMQMVVARNLFPLLPALAAFLGVASASALARLTRIPSRPRRVVAVSLALFALAVPASRTLELRIGLARASTRELMVDWVRANLPRGSVIFKESYTPDFGPGEYSVRNARFAARLSLDEILHPAHDALLLARNAYERFFVEANLVKEHHQEMRDRYQQIFDTQALLHEELPGRFRQGPSLRLYQVDPARVEFDTARTFAAAEAFQPGPQQKRGSKQAVIFARNRRWVSYRGYFAAGKYRVRLEGGLGGAATVEARSRDGRLHTGTELAIDGSGKLLDLPENGKYILILRAPPGSRIQSLTLTRFEG